MSKLVLGGGYLGTRVARQWLAAGEEVFVTTRSRDRVDQLAAEGFAPLVLDVTRPETLTDLPAVDAAVWAVGYREGESASRREVYVDGLRNVLAALPGTLRRFLHVSSTGVYAPTAGSVSEESPCRPMRESSRAILEGEEVLTAHPLGARAIILRLAGLYGPGRVPLAAQLRAGNPLAVAPDGVINLIHVEDAARAVLAAERMARPPRIYNVADGHPVPRRAFYEELARLLGLPPPEFRGPSPEEVTAARGGGHKWVDNSRLVEELAFSFRYPSYREGLASSGERGG
jgi:nucleoside-diphosphate-sugar epimerase